jgi:hypothetical protein
MVSPITVDMSDKKGFKRSFLDLGFCLPKQQAYIRYDPLFEEMSAETGARPMKKKRGFYPLLSYKHLLVQVKYIIYYCIPFILDLLFGSFIYLFCLLLYITNLYNN